MKLENKNLTENNPDISFDKINIKAGARPLLVEKYLVPEIQAEPLLSPMDQVYSPSTHLHGIRYVYRFIANSTRAFAQNMRTQLPAKIEVVQALQNESYKIGDIDKILDYLTKKSPPHSSFCSKYYAALFENEKLGLTPVYMAGNEDVEKVLNRADEASAKNIIEKAAVSQPWSDRLSHAEFLTEKIKSGKVHETYFLGYFKFDDTDNSNFSREVFDRRIFPLLKGRAEVLFYEIPLSLRVDNAADEPVLLINNNNDFKFRYQFFSAHLIASSKKILANEQIGLSEEVHNLRKAFEKIKKVKSPDSLKELAAALLDLLKKPNATRQIALEIFILSNKASEVMRMERKEKEAQNKIQVDLLLKRVHSRKWLTFIPASFYPDEIFSAAQNGGNVYGVKKSGSELGLKENFYCMVEAENLDKLLKNANWFELSIIEDILNANSIGSKEYFRKTLYRRKKHIVSLFINPFIYLFRILLPGGKSFIEKKFKKEIEQRGNIFTGEMKKCLETSGIKTVPASENSTSTKSKPTEKQLFTKRLIEIMFPDPAPGALWINEIEYREKIIKLARNLKNDPEFAQYAKKNEEAIIADIEPFLKEELIEDVYEGNLPGGLDHRGKKFTRKIFSPKFIKDQPIVYESIHEELDHELNQYGSRDLVEYYRARSKLFTELSMEKIRSSDKLKKEAERKEHSRISGNQDQDPALKPKEAKNKIDISPKIEDNKNEGLGKRKHKKEMPAKQSVSSRQKIEKTSQTISYEMKEKYITNKKFSGSSLFPITPVQMEELLDIETGTLSMFSNENDKTFAENFQVIKAGRQFYYFPKKFFISNKEQILKFYEELIKSEESNALPNREIVHKSQDIIRAISLR